jgi:SPP1 gp7 family putative phage head morphogenesis protein
VARTPALRLGSARLHVVNGRVVLFKQQGEHNVYEAMARQKRKVLAGEAAAVARMAGAYKVAAAAIQKDLAAVTAKIAAAQAAGLAISPAWLYQQDRFVKLLDTIQEQVTRYASTAANVAVAGQAAGFAQGAAHAKELAASAGLKLGFKGMNKDAFDGVVGMLTDKSPLHDLFKAMGPDAVAAARSVFAHGMAAGHNPHEIARALRDQIAGLSHKRAVLIARTESARAYVAAQRETYRQNSDVVIGSRWVSARDDRTCALCWAKDGTIIGHDEQVGLHPGCRCAFAPVVKYVEETRQTGEEVLQEREAAQPGYARTILGPARYDLWKSGQITLTDLVKDVDHPRWGRGIRARTLAQLKSDVAGGLAGRTRLTLTGLTPAQRGLIAVTKPVDLMAPNPLWVPPVPSVPSTPPTAVPAPAPAPAPVPIPAPAPPAPVPVPPAPAPAPTAAELAATVKQPSAKHLATDYTKALIKADGANLTAEEVAAIVKHHFPKSTATADSVLHHYGAAGVTPKNGFPAGYQYTPVPKSAPKAPAPVAAPQAPPVPVPAPVPPPPAPVAPPVAPPAPVPAPPPTAAQNILHQQIGAQGGSNPGGVYRGMDGVDRYVKFYADPAQAHGEHLANQIYRALGFDAPESVLFEHNGRVAYASRLLDVEGTVGAMGLTDDAAREILRGFAADVLTGNWDAVGTGLDNVVLLKGGGLARIDQGGTFLFRAQGGLKPDSLLRLITEWEGFAPGGMNPDYARVFAKAGYASPEEMGAALKKQIAAIQALRKRLGGWEGFVRANTPGLDPIRQQQIAAMLDARTDLLIERGKTLGKRAATKPAGVDSAKQAGRWRDPATIKATTPTDAEGEAMRKALYGQPYTTFAMDETNALSFYKGSGYIAMNEYMRATGVKPHLGPSAMAMIPKIKAMFVKTAPTKKDLRLHRGVRGHRVKDWYNLQPGDEGTILNDYSFTSTSNNLYTSTSFAGSGYDDHGVLLHIRIPKGTRMIPANNPAYGDGEHEWILDHARYVVRKISWIRGSGGKQIKVLDVDLVETMEGTDKWQRKIKPN